MPDAPAAGPRPVVYLHIGLPKSGTTYLQNLMSANRAQLSAAGVNFAGHRWRHQVTAVKDLLAYSSESDVTPRQWKKMARSMLRHPGVSVLSMEFLINCTDEQIRYALETLDGAEVHVLLTVRDAVASAPSQWQTGVRSGNDILWRDYARTMPLNGYVRTSLSRRSILPGMRHFARTQGVPWIMDAWLKYVPPERFHVVIVPTSRADPTLLWRRFAEVIGVTPDTCTEPPAFSRPSLGYASTSLIAMVNGRIPDRTTFAYRKVLRSYVSSKVLTERATVEGKIPLTRAVYRAGLRLNAANRRHMRKRGVHVVGDLEELATTLDKDRLRSLPRRVPAPDDEEVLAAAELAVRALGAQIRVSSTKGTPEAEPMESWPERPDLVEKWRAEANSVRVAVRDVTDAAERSMALRTNAHAGDEPRRFEDEWS